MNTFHKVELQAPIRDQAHNLRLSTLLVMCHSHKITTRMIDLAAIVTPELVPKLKLSRSTPLEPAAIAHCAAIWRAMQDPNKL